MVRRHLIVCIGGSLMISWLATMSSGQTADKPKKSGAAKLADEAKALAKELRDARESVKKVSDKELRDKLELQLARAELRALSLKEKLDAIPTTRAAISDADFQKLLKVIKAERFDKGKVTTITSLKGIRLTCEQLKTILKTFDFDDGRVTSGVYLYPMLTDPENIFIIDEVFTFDSSRRTFREGIGKLKK